MIKSRNALSLFFTLFILSRLFGLDLLENYFNLGKKYFQEKNYSDALINFQLALALVPDSFELYNNIGICHEKMKNLPKARENYEKALSLMPDFPQALNNLGLLLVRSNDSPQYGLSLVYRAHMLAPEIPEYFESLGEIYFAIGNHSRSLEWFARAEKRGITSASLYYHTGLTYLELEDRQQALESFKKSLKIDSRYLKAYVGIVKILEKWENYHEARSYLVRLDRQALDNLPDEEQLKEIYSYFELLYHNALYNLASSILREEKTIMRRFNITTLGDFVNLKFDLFTDPGLFMLSGTQVLTLNGEIEPAVFSEMPRIKNHYFENDRAICSENLKLLTAATFLHRVSYPDQKVTLSSVNNLIVPDVKIECPEYYDYSLEGLLKWSCERHGTNKPAD
ncbi:MAG: tetratricopeptide repeat protein [Candidatus Wallbacteria bacterium]|nr:tetratricopeptide repeat protein [Candidatus Wallbacteria bacterium]